MNTRWVKHKRIRSLLAGFCFAFVGLSGCDKGGAATVTGKVTFNGQSLTAGTVSFIAGPNRVGSGVINADGTYSIGDAPVGDVTVTVETPQQAPGGMAGGMPKPPPGVKGMPADMQPPGAHTGAPGRIVPAPEKYKSAETSPLKFTVQRGTQSYDIELKP